MPNTAYYGQHATELPPLRDAAYSGPPPLYDAPPQQQFDAPQPPARAVDSWYVMLRFCNWISPTKTCITFEC